MAYKIEQEGTNVYTIRSPSWWRGMGYRDLVSAIIELAAKGRVESVTRYNEWHGGQRYLVVVGEK